MLLERSEIQQSGTTSPGSKNMPNSEKTFSVKWFDPRDGGELKKGSISSVKGPGISTIGNPPEKTEKD